MKHPLLVLVLLISCLVGCSNCNSSGTSSNSGSSSKSSGGSGDSFWGAGLVSSHQDRMRRYKMITDYNLREAVDDWDYFWLYDRPSYLTYWNLRTTGE